MTWVAKRTFTAQYASGDSVVINEGDRCVDDYEIAQRYPDEFEYVYDGRELRDACVGPSQNGHAATVRDERARSGGSQPRRRTRQRRQLTAEEQAQLIERQGRIRRHRLAELAEREADGWRK
jgi:hypothetical protein